MINIIEIIGKELYEDYRVYLEKKMPKIFPDITVERTRLLYDECLKFLYLGSLMKGNCRVPISVEVDEVWHFLIMETSAYDTLCRKLPRGKLLHHASNDFPKRETEGKGDSDEDIGAESKRLLSYIPLYVKYFGDFREEVAGCWPFIEAVKRLAQWQTLEEVNAFGRAHKDMEFDF